MVKTRSSGLRHGVIALAAAASLGAAALPAAAAPAAHAAGSCSAPRYPGNGYFTSLRVTRTSCAKGRKVARAHYHCRTAHGVSGRCHHAVLGYHCTEYRPASARIPTQYNSRVTCKSGSRRVVFVYQQNT
ncbi:MAG: hypothetical protein QOF08_2234 [Gaiellales bacterium]|nr:hypothetical protein [Gaiellales bacterium]